MTPTQGANDRDHDPERPSPKSDRTTRGSETARKSKLILAFDAGCGLCTQLARDIEDIASSRLRALSLRDPEVGRLVARSEQAVSFEPMLIDPTQDPPQIWTGLGLKARLALVLGPVSALRVGRMAVDAGAVRNPRRRTLLKNAPWAAAGAAATYAFGFPSVAAFGQEGGFPEIKGTYLAESTDEVTELKRQLGTLKDRFDPAWDRVMRLDLVEKGGHARIVSSPTGDNMAFDLVGASGKRATLVAEATPDLNGLSFSTADGRYLGTVTIDEEGVFTATDEGASEIILAAGSDTTAPDLELAFSWSCFTVCLAAAGLGVGWFCRWFVSACLAVPTLANPTCWSLLTCIGYGAVTCFIACM